MYQEGILEIEEEVLKYNRDVEKIDGANRLAYLQSISSRKLYFPDNVRHSYDFYIDVKINQLLSGFDLVNYLDIKENIEIVSSLETFKSPKIYCAFHYGSYKIINCILHEQNIDFSVVANKTIIDNSENELLELHQKELIRSSRKIDFNIIDANSNSGMVKMIRTLKEGKSLVIYIDGGNGLQGFNKNIEKTTIVNFLDKKIYSRSGIAFLSNHLNIPIVPVVSKRLNGLEKIKVTFFEEILPKANNEESIKLTTQKLWDIFSEEVTKDPTQWEAILYAHHFLIDDSICVEETKQNVELKHYSFNTEEFDFLQYPEGYYLYSCTNFWTFKLSENIFRFLNFLKEAGKPYSYAEMQEVSHENVLNDLINKKVLI